MDLERLFENSDQNHDGFIDRKEFEKLITGYFELKGIKSTKENYDTYFEKLDVDHDHKIKLTEFIHFVDTVNETDIIPFITEEMQNRELL